jgi:hypothetical protein
LPLRSDRRADGAVDPVTRIAARWNGNPLQERVILTWVRRTSDADANGSAVVDTVVAAWDSW